jgi:hypothetical protein
MIPLVLSFVIMAFFITLTLHFAQFTADIDDQAIIGLSGLIMGSTFGCFITGMNQGINTYIARAYGAKNK